MASDLQPTSKTKIWMPLMDNTVLAWTLGGIVAVVGSLAAAVVALWKKTDEEAARTRKLLDECEGDRRALHVECGILKDRVGKLEVKQ